MNYWNGCQREMPNFLIEQSRLGKFENNLHKLSQQKPNGVQIKMFSGKYFRKNLNKWP